ncbi:MAG: hypothetical protein ACTSYO_06695, partial [Candidatus Ranarchaeia archaeon]
LFLRSSPPWLKEIRCILVDELHLIGRVQNPQSTILEGLIQRIRQRLAKTQFIGFAEPFGNTLELAEWLGLSLLEDKDRETRLRISVLFARDKMDKVLELSRSILVAKRQALIFVNSRKRAEKYASFLAQMVGQATKETLSEHVKSELRALKNRDWQNTPLSSLHSLLSKQISFFHDGLSLETQKLIEQGFQQGWIKIIVSTIAFNKKFDSIANMIIIVDNQTVHISSGGIKIIQDIDTNLIHQLLSMAGYKQGEKDAFGIILAQDEQELKKLIQKSFIQEFNGQLKPKYIALHSSLGEERYLIQQLIIEIADNPGINSSQLKEFLEHTFYAFQHKTDLSVVKALTAAGSYLADDFLAAYAEPTVRVNALKIDDDQIRHTRTTKRRVEGVVRSSSRKGRWYKLFFDMDNGPGCDCEYFKYHGRRIGQSPITGRLIRHDKKERTSPSPNLLCKHLIRFGQYMLLRKGDKNTASSIIVGSLGEKSFLGKLITHGLVEQKKHGLYATEIGKICSKFFLDFKLMANIHKKIVRCRTEKINEEKILNDVVKAVYQTDSFPVYIEAYLRKNCLAVLSAWIHEIPLDIIARDFKSYPNDIARLVDYLAVVTHVFSEIAYAKRKKNIASSAQLLEQRLCFGVELELLPLVGLRIPLLDRYVARLLFEAGIQTKKDLLTSESSRIQEKTGIDPSLIAEIKSFLIRSV